MARVLAHACSGGKTAKLHLPSLPPGLTESDDLPVPAAPKCGAQGKFEYLKVDDAMDATVGFCQRCSPCTEYGDCKFLRSHMGLADKGATPYRCVRRCCEGSGKRSDHFRALHQPGDAHN